MYQVWKLFNLTLVQFVFMYILGSLVLWKYHSLCYLHSIFLHHACVVPTEIVLPLNIGFHMFTALINSICQEIKFSWNKQFNRLPVSLQGADRSAIFFFFADSQCLSLPRWHFCFRFFCVLTLQMYSRI